MSTTQTILAAGLLFCLATGGFADDLPVYSGPQVGERLIPFKAIGVYDQVKGKELDLVSMAGDRPFLLVFVHTSNRPNADLTRALLHYADVRQEELFSALVFLTDDITETERQMKSADGWWHIGPPTGISLDGGEGPGSWGLNRNVNMTVLVGIKGRVTANFALVQTSDSDTARVIPEVTKLVGGTVPTVPEVEFLRSPTRLPPIVKQWESGKAPIDLKMRSLFCTLLREHEDQAATDKTIAEIKAYIAEKPALRDELGEAARMVLVRGYGSRPPIVELVPELRDTMEEWDETYFNPEFLSKK